MFLEWIRQHNRSDTDPHKNLKRAVGILGMLLPLICIVGGYDFLGHPVQNSVSHYYHTNMRDVLVGLLGCVAILFMTHKGYGVIDNLVTWAIGLAAAGVVAFPCPTDPQSGTPVGIFLLKQETSGSLHIVFAGAFFLLLAINLIFLFTLTDQERLGRKKALRNIIYIASGAVILASLATLLITNRAANDFFRTSSIALLFESIMLFVFGVSWLVKGEIPLLRDRKHGA